MRQVDWRVLFADGLIADDGLACHRQLQMQAVSEICLNAYRRLVFATPVISVPFDCFLG